MLEATVLAVRVHQHGGVHRGAACEADFVKFASTRLWLRAQALVNHNWAISPESPSGAARRFVDRLARAGNQGAST